MICVKLEQPFATKRTRILLDVSEGGFLVRYGKPETQRMEANEKTLKALNKGRSFRVLSQGGPS